MKEEFQRELSLKSQLAAMMQRYRQTLLISRSLELVVWCGAAIIVFCVLDYVLPLPMQGRLALSIVLYVSLATLISWVLLRPLLKKLNQERMAWMLENRCKGFDESLVSALSFDQQDQQQVSVAMKEKVVDDAEAQLHQYHPLVLFRINKKWLGLAMLAGFIYLGLFIFYTPHSGLLLKRIFVPSSMDARPGSFVLEEIHPDADHYIEGDAVHFKARISGRHPELVRLRLRQNSERVLEMAWNEDDKTFDTTIEGLVGDVYYRFEAEDVMTAERFLRYHPRPKIEEFHITYDYPDYTGLKVKEFKSRSGELQALVGTKVQVKAIVNKRLSSHTLNWMEINELKGHSMPGPLEVVFEKVIEKDGSYHLNFVDSDQISSDLSPIHRITAIPDKAPKVTWMAMDPEIYLTPTSVLQCQWLAEDDFGVQKQTLFIKRGQEVLSEVEINTSESSKNLELAKYTLRDGDSLELSLQVSDALQSTTSEIIKLHIVDDAKIQFALPFVKKCESALEQLDGLYRQFSKVKNTIELIPAASPDQLSFESSEREHQLGVQKIRLQRLSDKMQLYSNGIDDLQRMAFFPQSEAALSLEQRYLEHLQLNDFFSLLEEPELSEPLDSLIQSTQLNKNLLEALKEKAQSHYDRFEMVRHLKLKQDISDNVIMGLREKYLAPVAFLNQWENSKVGQGLNVFYIKDRKWYPNPLREGFPQNMDKQFVSPKLDFRNIATMGWNHHQVFSATWYGYLKAPKKGSYKFFLNSDDGSRCYINGQLIVNNDGNHAMQEKQGGVFLEKGYHFVEIVYYNSEGEAGLQWFWQPPDEGKYLVPDYVLRTSLHEKEMQDFWNSSLIYQMDVAVNDLQPIEKAMREIEMQLPRDSLDLNMAVAQLEDREEDSWKKARQVQNHLETLSHEAEKEDVAKTQEQAARLLAEILEDKDKKRLQQFNDILNESKREPLNGRIYLSPEVEPLLAQLEKEEMAHLELALSELSHQEGESTDETLAKAMNHLEKAKSSIMDDLIEQLQGQDKKQEIAGDLAVLKSLEAAQSEVQSSSQPVEELSQMLKDNLEKTQRLAQANEAFKQDQMSSKEKQEHRQKVSDILKESHSVEQYEQVALRDQLQELQTETNQMKHTSEVLEKQPNHHYAKALAERANAASKQLKKLDPKGQPISQETTNLKKQPINMNHLSHQIHHLQEKLNQAHEQQNQRKSAQQLAGVQRAQAQELLNKINREQLDHQQDQAFMKTQASLDKELWQTRDSLRPLADKMKDDKNLQKELKELAQEMSPVSDRERQIPHYRRSEQDRLREMAHASVQVENELRKSSTVQAKMMENTLQSSLQAAEEGRYEDARRGLNALQKDALSLAQVGDEAEDESSALSNALDQLRASEQRIQNKDKPVIQKAQEQAKHEDYRGASKTLAPLLKQHRQKLEHLEMAGKVAKAQNEEKHALEASEREFKQGRFMPAAMQMANIKDQQELAQQILILEQERQALLDTLETKQIHENDQNFRKDLQEAIKDGKQGKFKSMHRELSRSKGTWDEELKKAESLSKKEEQLSKAIDQAQKDQKQFISEAKSKFKNDLSQSIKDVRSQLSKNKDHNKRDQLNQEVNQLNHELKMSQSQNLNDYKHRLLDQLRGVSEAQLANESLKKASQLKADRDEAPSVLRDEDAAKLSQVGDALKQAEQPLSQGQANQQSTKSFQSASDALASMVAKMDQQRLAELQKAKAQLLAATPALAEDNNDETPTEGSEFKFDPDESQVILNRGDWDGLQGALKEQGGQGTENIYDDYFNRANNRYLQKILKASRQWK